MVKTIAIWAGKILILCVGMAALGCGLLMMYGHAQTSRIGLTDDELKRAGIRAAQVDPQRLWEAVEHVLDNNTSMSQMETNQVKVLILNRVLDRSEAFKNRAIRTGNFEDLAAIEGITHRSGDQKKREFLDRYILPSPTIVQTPIPTETPLAIPTIQR